MEREEYEHSPHHLRDLQSEFLKKKNTYATKNCQIFERCFFFPYYAILSSLVSSSSHFHTFSDFPLKNQSLHVITENGCGNRVNCRRSRP